jgi:hypothetical protein
MEKINKNYLIFGAGAIVVMAFIFWQKNFSSPSPNRVTYGEVDKARKQEQTKSQLQREKVHIENYKKAPQISDAYRPVESSPASEDGLRLEASVSAAAKDIGEAELSGMAVESLENKINRRLLNEQKTDQMNAIQKKEFAAEYKKKALAMGYAVELNENLEVVKVQKVEKPKLIKSNPVIDVDSMDEEDEEFE